MWFSEVVLATVLVFLVSIGDCVNISQICTRPKSPTIYQGAIFEPPSPYYIYSQGDADLLTQNNCSTVHTSIIISPNSTSSKISLGSIQSIWWNLEVVSAASLTTLSAPNLGSILGNFTLNNLSSLSEIDFPNLNDSYALSLYSLPQLKSLTFPKAMSWGFVGVNGVNISQTGLSTIEGSYGSEEGQVTIVNNTDLKLLNLTQTTSSSILISSNGGQTTIAMSHLSEAQNLQIEDCAGLDLSNFKGVGENVIIQGNSFTELDLPNLKQLGGLVVKDNPNLSSINLPTVTSMMDIDIEDNSQSGTLISAPNLRYMTSLTLAGNFTMAWYEGLGPRNINISSTVPGFNCAPYDGLAKQGSYDSYSCRASEPGSDKDTAVHLACYNQFCLSKGAKAGIGVGVAVAVLLMVVAALWFFRWRKMPSDAINGPWYIKLRIWARRLDTVPKPPKYVDIVEMEPPRYQDLGTQPHNT